MRSLVTGATGLLGSHLVEQLVKQDDEVRVLVRPSHDTAKLRQQGIEAVVGDLTNRESLVLAVADVDVVYHTAGQVAAASPEHFLSINVRGTANLLEVSTKAGVGRFVFVSSVIIYQNNAEGPLLENAPQRSPDNSYAGSKVHAERLVWQYYHDRGLPVSVIRPCIMHGERDRNFGPQIMRMARFPVWPLPSGGRNHVDVVYAGDVAEALILAGTRAKAVGQAYNVTDNRATTLRDIAQACRLVNAGRPVLVSLPSVLSSLLLQILRMVRGPHRPTPLLEDKRHDCSKICQELGYSPTIDIYEGIRRYVSWCRSQSSKRLA